MYVRPYQELRPAAESCAAAGGLEAPGEEQRDQEAGVPASEEQFEQSFAEDGFS